MTVTQATSNLSMTIIGAGIMALSKAFATLGMVLGLVILSSVFFLSLFSLAALVKAAQRSSVWTYRGVAKRALGRTGGALYVAAVLCNNAGSMIVYLIIVGDVLVGVAPDYSGLWTNLVGVHDPSVWYVWRPAVIGALCLFVLAPLVSLHDLSLLGPISRLAVFVAAGFAATVALVAGAAVWEGRLADFSWLPDSAVLGATLRERAVNVLAVLPVVTMCFVCHYNLLPIASALERFSERRIHMVIRRSLGISSGVFVLVAAGGYALFGSHTSANVLNNLTPEGLAVFVPETVAQVVSFAVRAGYCVCLVSTFTMLNWTLRSTVSTLIWKEHMPATKLHFFGLTYALLATLYLVSILFPNVWAAMSLTGSTAAVLIAFILPGALAVHFARPEERLARILGKTCIGLGILIGVVGVLNTFLG